MAKPIDPTIKLSKQAKTDAGKIVELLDRTVTPCAVSPEAQVVLEQTPELAPEFIASQAERFDVPIKRVDEIAQTVAQEQGAAITVEQREISVDAEVKDFFRELYQKEIEKRSTCSYIVKTSHIGKTGKESSTWEACGDKLETIQQFLVHQSMHIICDSGDPRTQRAMLNDIRELLYPVQEKSIRAVMGADERKERWEALERHRSRLGRD
jgi:hypothetical protein